MVRRSDVQSQTRGNTESEVRPEKNGSKVCSDPTEEQQENFSKYNSEDQI